MKNKKTSIKNKSRLVCLTLLLFMAFPLWTHGTEIEKSRVEEDLYGRLDYDGQVETMDLLVRGQKEGSGSLIYLGTWSDLENLKQGGEVIKNSQGVVVEGKKGEFFFKGTLEEAPFPWDITIRYFLDGKEVEANALAGATGTVRIEILTEKNPANNQGFFENYMVQITTSLDRNRVEVKSTDGNRVNQGNHQMIHFLSLPGEKGDFYWQGEVENFSMKALQFSALPFSSSVTPPDGDSLTQGLDELSRGVALLKEGAVELEDGFSQYTQGVTQAKDNVSMLSQGLGGAVGGANDLVGASSQILSALETLDGETENIEDLQQLDDGLAVLENGLNQIKNDYENAFASLEGAITAMDTTIDEGELQLLETQNSGNGTFAQLLASYRSAQTVKDTYNNHLLTWESIGPSLDQSIEAIGQMRSQLQSAIADGNQLSMGIHDLYNEYLVFHNGLVAYGENMETLSQSGTALTFGLEQGTASAASLEMGMKNLRTGLEGLEKETKQLPITITAQIEAMANPYEQKDFQVRSFASDENGQVQSVQFVLVTKDIRVVEEEKVEEKEEKKNSWEKFLDLFR